MSSFGQFARFGHFEADLTERKLTKMGARIRLQEQPFRILLILLEHPGQIVTRDQIRQQVWAQDTFVDFDAALNTAMRKLREALNDSADNPRFLETIPRQGYRFLGPVSWSPELQVATLTTRPDRRRLYLWASTALIMLAGAVGGFRYLRSAVIQITPKDTIVLADFANSTGDEILDDTLKTALNGPSTERHGI